MDGLPEFAGPVATDASKADLIALYTRVKNDGFTMGETAELVGHGAVGEPDRRPARRVLARPLERSRSTRRCPPSCARQRTRWRPAAPGLDEFLRSAGVSAGRANVAPVASFTATPDTGPAPLTVHFADTSTNTDLDTLTRDWDFGDGSTATGASVDHTYTHRAGVRRDAQRLRRDRRRARSATRSTSPARAAAGRTRFPTARGRHARHAVQHAGSRRRARERQRRRRRRADRLRVHERRARLGDLRRRHRRLHVHAGRRATTGPDQFTYTASDGRGGTATANVAVTVQPVAGTPPNANADTLDPARRHDRLGERARERHRPEQRPAHRDRVHAGHARHR